MERALRKFVRERAQAWQQVHIEVLGALADTVVDGDKRAGGRQSLFERAGCEVWSFRVFKRPS